MQKQRSKTIRLSSPQHPTQPHARLQPRVSPQRRTWTSNWGLQEPLEVDGCSNFPKLSDYLRLAEGIKPVGGGHGQSPLESFLAAKIPGLFDNLHPRGPGQKDATAPGPITAGVVANDPRTRTLPKSSRPPVAQQSTTKRKVSVGSPQLASPEQSRPQPSGIRQISPPISVKQGPNRPGQTHVSSAHRHSNIDDNARHGVGGMPYPNPAVMNPAPIKITNAGTASSTGFRAVIGAPPMAQRAPVLQQKSAIMPLPLKPKALAGLRGFGREMLKGIRRAFRNISPKTFGARSPGRDKPPRQNMTFYGATNNNNNNNIVRVLLVLLRPPPLW